MSILTNSQDDELGFYTRSSDGVSGMTVTALADFCGTEQQTITQILNRIRDSDPITNDLQECLKHVAGKDLRLITNDPQGSMFIVDEVCHAVLEYYAIDARKYKGKQLAVANYRMIAKAGLRVFIWSQTGYSPAQEALTMRVTELEQKLATALLSIATIQSQIGNLLPPDNNFAPPGWDAETWLSLPPQDKRHFRFLARRRRFRPDNQTLALPSNTIEEIKLIQRAEIEQLLDPIPDEEKARLDAAKQEMLARFWAEGGES